MNRINAHIIFQFVSQLLVVSMACAVLFGNGVHLHLSFHNLFEHGSFNITLHSHTSTDVDDIPGSGSGENEPHQHPVATIEFTGTVSHHILTGVSSFVVLQTGLFTIDDFNTCCLTTERFALPPPETIASHLTTPFFSLRAPPAA